MRKYSLLLGCLLIGLTGPGFAVTVFTEDFGSGIDDWELHNFQIPASPEVVLLHENPDTILNTGDERMEMFFPSGSSVGIGKVHRPDAGQSLLVNGDTLTFTFEFGFSAVGAFATQYDFVFWTDISGSDAGEGIIYSYNPNTNEVSFIGGTGFWTLGTPLVADTMYEGSLEIMYDGVAIQSTLILNSEPMSGSDTLYTASAFTPGFRGSSFGPVIQSYYDNAMLTFVPEPSGALLVLSGAAVLGGGRRRSRRGLTSP